jgi:hypothetical protein
VGTASAAGTPASSRCSEESAGRIDIGFAVIIGRQRWPHRHRFVDGSNPEHEDEERADCKGQLITGHPLASENTQDTAAKDGKRYTEAAERNTHRSHRRRLRGYRLLTVQHVIGVERNDPAGRGDKVDAGALYAGETEIEAIEE